MKPKSLAVAAVSAVALIAVGLGVQQMQKAPRAASHSGDPLYPDLLDEINDVVAMKVTTPEASYRIARTDGVWGLEEKGGYPVDAGQVTKAILTLAQLEKIEPKTSDPARYVEIGVEDVDAADAKSKLVTLEGAGGKELAALIVGERKGGRAASLYVRKAGEAGSWLVSGDLQLREDGVGWLDKKIVELKRDQVRAVRTTQPDGQAVLVSKADREATNFDVQEVPAERELKYATVANGMGGALEYLNLQDVLPAAGFEAPEGEPVRTSFWTWDGMRVDVALHDKDGKAYASFRASYDAEGPPGLAEVVGPAPPPEGGEEAAEGDETAEGEEAAAEVKRAETEVRQEAEKLDARLAPWVFEIPAYNKTNLSKKMEDLLAEPVAEEEPAAMDEEAAPIELSTEGGDELEPTETPTADDGAAATDEPAGDEPPADEPPADEPPADEPPADEPPADEPTGGGDEPAPAPPAPAPGDGDR